MIEMRAVQRATIAAGAWHSILAGDNPIGERQRTSEMRAQLACVAALAVVLRLEEANA
jgi:hypothetical protein